MNEWQSNTNESSDISLKKFINAVKSWQATNDLRW